MGYSSRNFWLLMGLGLAAIIAAHLLPHAIRGSGGWSVPAIGFGVLMALGCGLFGLSYGAMDDIQKQNIKSDWYWGSVAGLVVLCGLVFPFVLFGDGIAYLGGLAHKGETPKGYFFAGVMVTVGLFALGWLAMLLVRRLRWMK
jgi:hypothetical protein